MEGSIRMIIGSAMLVLAVLCAPANGEEKGRKISSYVRMHLPGGYYESPSGAMPTLPDLGLQPMDRKKNRMAFSRSSPNYRAPVRRLGEDSNGGYGGGSSSQGCNGGGGCSDNDEKCCSNSCVKVKKNKNHCGGCSNTCGQGLECCDGKCVNTNEDKHNCGSCDNKCQGNKKCEQGVCGYNSY